MRLHTEMGPPSLHVQDAPRRSPLFVSTPPPSVTTWNPPGVCSRHWARAAPVTSSRGEMQGWFLTPLQAARPFSTHGGQGTSSFLGLSHTVLSRFPSTLLPVGTAILLDSPSGRFFSPNSLPNQSHRPSPVLFFSLNVIPMSRCLTLQGLKRRSNPT